MLVIFAGPGTNLLFAIIIFAALFVVGSGGYRLGFSMETNAPKNAAIVHDVRADHPAAKIGLRPGDRILRINGQRVQDVSEVPDLIQQSKGAGSRSSSAARATPRPIILRARPAPLGAATLGAAGDLAVGEADRGDHEGDRSLASRLVRGNRKEVSSPVGIVEGSSEALAQGAQTYLWVLGLLSLSLALLNLLPFLPLDGGHIVFSLIEGIRGRAVGREVYERASAIGIAVVLLLFFIGLSNDIGNLGN